MNRFLLYLVLGVVGLGLTFVALVYLSIQVAKIFAVAALLLIALLVGKRLLTRDKDEGRLGHDGRLSVKSRDERRRVRHG